ncbi:MAG: hypothetical protein JNK48_28455 [Bryobacterales bacterium]|nr:hypothetical protein [Bryobacterales bacterium]
MPLYVIPATHADRAVVFRRGPSAWWHLLEWRLDEPALSAGAWFHGALYPRRCDVSPDGRLLGYFALKANARNWPASYFAVSRPPYLHALAAWKTAGSWTWGCRFASGDRLEIHGCLEDAPFHGAFAGQAACHPMSCKWDERVVWNERKRGWLTQGAGTLGRKQPLGECVLLLLNRGEGMRPDYLLQSAHSLQPLEDAVWCDWDRRGRLLLATRRCELVMAECMDGELHTVWRADLSGLRPKPAAPPEWACNW